MAPVLLLSLALIAYSSTVHLVPGFNLLYVPIGIAATLLLLIGARRLLLTNEDLGLDASTRRAGLVAGSFVAVAAAIILAIGLLLPGLRPLFDDERVADAGFWLVAYRALIRIPLGTALFEEFAFRGVLLGLWQRVRSQRQAILGSSLVFGLWHIRPAFDLLNANAIADGALLRIGIVSAAVVGTAGAGVFFAALRARTGSLWAPFVAHASINSLAIIAAACAAHI